MHPTKQHLINEGLRLLLKQGYSDLGIQTLLAATGTPKGSFYHHFKDKEDFALQVVDAYMEEVHAGLEACLNDSDRLPLQRVRHFFEMTEQKYREEGYLGCLLGGLGQELSGVNPVFRRKIESCLAAIAERIARCLEEARTRGQIRTEFDPRQLLGRGRAAQPSDQGSKLAPYDVGFLYPSGDDGGATRRRSA
jgi:TetR/AcrR family transcriptional regulator, transcriptional repressor for nem operon